MGQPMNSEIGLGLAHAEQQPLHFLIGA